MKRLTQPENQIKLILEGLGYIVKDWTQQMEADPPNIVYSQVPIVRKGGKVPFCADFVFPYAQIDLEVDGEYWHQESAKIKDWQRDQELKKMGWKIIRLPSRIVKNTEIVAKTLRHGLWHLLDLA